MMTDADRQGSSSSVPSPSTAATSPEAMSQGVADDDIWASDSEHNDDSNEVTGNRADMLSDLPSVKRQHMTDGYREGLSIGKAQVMQAGFDEGYPIGIAIALRAGRVIGCLEGVVAAKDIPEENKIPVRKLLDQAKQELPITELLRNMDDQKLTAATGVPDSVRDALTKWENKVLGAHRPSEDAAISASDS